MKIDSYSFEDFKTYAAELHGYPAPGLLSGGYMVAMAKRALPEGSLLEAVLETKNVFIMRCNYSPFVVRATIG